MFILVAGLDDGAAEDQPAQRALGLGLGVVGVGLLTGVELTMKG